MTYIINPLTNQIITDSIETVKLVTGLDVSALKAWWRNRHIRWKILCGSRVGDVNNETQN